MSRHMYDITVTDSLHCCNWLDISHGFFKLSEFLYFLVVYINLVKHFVDCRQT